MVYFCIWNMSFLWRKLHVFCSFRSKSPCRKKKNFLIYLICLPIWTFRPKCQNAFVVFCLIIFSVRKRKSLSQSFQNYHVCFIRCCISCGLKILLGFKLNYDEGAGALRVIQGSWNFHYAWHGMDVTRSEILQNINDEMRLDWSGLD